MRTGCIPAVEEIITFVPPLTYERQCDLEPSAVHPAHAPQDMFPTAWAELIQMTKYMGSLVPASTRAQGRGWDQTNTWIWVTHTVCTVRSRRFSNPLQYRRRVSAARASGVESASLVVVSFPDCSGSVYWERDQ